MILPPSPEQRQQVLKHSTGSKRGHLRGIRREKLGQRRGNAQVAYTSSYQACELIMC